TTPHENAPSEGRGGRRVSEVWMPGTGRGELATLSSFRRKPESRAASTELVVLDPGLRRGDEASGRKLRSAFQPQEQVAARPKQGIKPAGEARPPQHRRGNPIGKIDGRR